MRNPLLKRQIDKFLNEQDYEGLDRFLAAIDDSYNNYEDQISMLQRAMKISSDELFEANSKLRDEAKSLKEANKNLEFILNSMKMDITADDARNFSTAEYINKLSGEIIEITKQREALLKNLEAQNQELNEYAHMVSHDLKAPLRNINTLITWILQDYSEKFDLQARKSFGLILFNLEKMDLLIDGILDYSSVDKIESESRVIDFNLIVQEIERTLMLPDSVHLTVSGKLPSLYGNYYRYMQLFQNLIENAVKYNDKEIGHIEIGHIDREDLIEFYVKDNGKGIHKDYFDKIFNIFTKLDSDSHSSGVGLSIVKKIINFYGGTIWLESTEGNGTTFFFTLPKKWNSPT